MKILGLRLKNINSLKGENHIDFTATPLSDTGLFAITGPTGSGKSTLLDAITLALYNQVPRSGKISKNNIQSYGSIITRGADESYAEVDYSINGNIYRSKWEISRARTGNLREYNMELSMKNSEGDFVHMDVKRSEIPSKNAEITSLNYDQFIKSILLSQGEFARFLKADAKERSELLEKITGTEIYRIIGQAAYERLKAENEKLFNINNQLSSIELLDEEQKQSVDNELIQLKQSIKKISTDLNKIKDQLLIKRQITTFNKELNNKQQELSDNKKAIEAFKPEKLKLDRHIKLMQIKAELMECTRLKDQLAQLVIKQQEEQKHKTGHQELLLKLNESQKKQDNHFGSLKEEKKTLLPLLREIRELDQTIKGLDEKVKDQQKEIANNQNERDKLAKDIIILTNKLDKDKKNREQLDRWIKDHALFNEIRPVLPLIENETNLMKATYIKLSQELKTTGNNDLIQILSKGKNWNEKVETLQQLSATLQKQLEDTSLKLNKLKFSNRKELEGQQNILNTKLLQLEIVQRIQKEHTKDLPLEITITQEIKKLSKERESIALQLEKEKKEISYLEALTKEQEATFLRVKLESTLTDLRDQLKPNEPCPLCGSTNHPYVQSYTEQISKAEQLFRTTKEKYEQLQKNYEKSHNLNTRIEAQLDGKNQEIKSLREKQQERRNEFSDNTLVKDEQISIEKPEQLSSLNLKLKNQQEILTKIQELILQKDKIAQEIQQLNSITEKSQQIRDAWKKAHTLADRFKEFIDISKGIPDQVNELRSNQKSYEDNNASLQKLEKEIGEQSSSLKERAAQLEKQQNTLKLKQAEFSQWLEKLNKQRHIRKVKFEDKDPDRENDKLEFSLEQAQKLINDTRQKITETSSRADHHQKMWQQYSQEHKNITVQYQKNKENLTPLVKQIGFDDIAEALEAMLPQQEADDLQQRREQLEKLKITIEQSLQEKQKEILRIQEKEDKEITTQQLEQQEQELERGNKEHLLSQGSLEQQLKKDLDNRQKAGSIIQKRDGQEKECRRWNNLNELMGDATGNKYSKFAQELTLQQLLSLANGHLLKLNKRYLLRYNPDQNEDLFVVDTLQGNEERSVRTLSGGESFLISLALALGLSDLAGQNTRIESLFIDEGFGSLDQDTLEAALSTLERLQSESNRTIGIISHVVALKERITTQIELTKDSRGFSTIELLN